MKFVEKLQGFVEKKVFRRGWEKEGPVRAVTELCERPCLLSNPKRDRKLRVSDVALVIPKADSFNDTWGVY